MLAEALECQRRDLGGLLNSRDTLHRLLLKIRRTSHLLLGAKGFKLLCEILFLSPSELPFERGRPAIPSAPSWAEFLSASTSGKMESDFALLTLSDHEQRELYEAARVIQTAFRKYKVRASVLGINHPWPGTPGAPTALVEQALIQRH